MLTLKGINKDYKLGISVIRALDNINVSFREHEFVSVVGPSGCGKTTLLNIIGGLDKYTSGDMIIHNLNTLTFKEKDWDNYRNHSIGFVFQNYNLIHHLTIYENIEMALLLSPEKRINRKKKILDVLDKVGLLNQKNKLPNQLSGGQMQRVAIARAIVNDPDIILADEPTGALDSKTSLEIVDILKQISKKRLVIMVTHNETLVNQFSDRIVRLFDGKLVSDSHPYLPENEVAVTKNKTKTSMNFITALKLSFRNLITKKLRTFLITIGGSVGIIGVCLVLTISNGVSVYIEDIQKSTLSNYPITIRSTPIDDAPLEEEKDFVPYPNNNIINVVNLNRYYYGHINMFTPTFLDYLEDINPSLYNVIDYKTSLDMKIITLMNGKYKKVPLYKFYELSEDVDYISTQYDVLYGKLPTEKNELALLVDKYNNIDVSVLNYLCIDYENIEKYTFDEISNKEYKVILNNDYYQKKVDGTYGQLGSPYYEDLYQKSPLTLKITGIIRISQDAKTNLYDNGVLYSRSLREFLINDAIQSDIVKDQLQYKMTKNVFTGEPFEDQESISGIVKKEYLYESQLVDLGVNIEINTIRIYTDRFNSRILINDYLNDYNQNKNYEDKILYSDYMGNITIEFDAFVSILTKVLIAFAGISLFVSSIMIGIISYISVMERIKEIGILRSLGARRKDIARVFNAETFIIGFTSGVLGILFGMLLLKPIINMIIKIMKTYDLTTFDLSQMIIANFNILYFILLIGGSILLTVISGLIPAIIAANKSPVNAIKIE